MFAKIQNEFALEVPMRRSGFRKCGHCTSLWLAFFRKRPNRIYEVVDQEGPGSRGDPRAQSPAAHAAPAVGADDGAGRD